MSMKLNNRKLYIDFLRVLAIYMVLFNHTGTKGFVLFTVARDSMFYWFYLFLAIFIKIAVPIFFMISGALLLPKEEDLKSLYKKRVLKYLLILIVCSLMYYVVSKGFNLSEISIANFIEILYSSQLSTAYWYLYSYLAFLILLPLLHKLAKAMSDTEYTYLIILFLCMKLLDIFEFFVWKGTISHNAYFSLFINSSNIFYPLIGYYLEERLDESSYSVSNLIKLVVASIGSIVVCGLLTHYRCHLINEWSESSCQYFFGTLIFVPSITVYYGAKLLFNSITISSTLAKWIKLISSCTFGVFLFEKIYRTITVKVYDILSPYIYSLPACLIWILIACILGTVVTYGLKKIPIVNKFI